MTDEKTNEFAFDGGSKESFRERLKMLIGERSIRAAASCWGLSFSTLNNYLNKGTEPSFTAIRSIAYKEQISLDWLAFGSYDELSNNLKARSGKTGIDDNGGKLMTAWLMVLDSLDAQEAQAILRIIHRKGIEGVISACMKTDTTNENNITSNVERALLELPPEEQERLMALHEAKKGAAPQENQIEDVTSLGYKKSGVA